MDNFAANRLSQISGALGALIRYCERSADAEAVDVGLIMSFASMAATSYSRLWDESLCDSEGEREEIGAYLVEIAVAARDNDPFTLFQCHDAHSAVATDRNDLRDAWAIARDLSELDPGDSAGVAALQRRILGES